MIHLCHLLDEEGGTPEKTGLSEDFLNGAATRKDLINYMAIVEDSMEKKMMEMEERIITSHQQKNSILHPQASERTL